MNINPWDNKCCATCECLTVYDDKGTTRVCATDSCPHARGVPFYEPFGYFQDEITTYFDFVCNSWKGRRQYNLDIGNFETEEEGGK